MYKPSKKLLASVLAAGMLISVSAVNFDVEAGQEYDSSNVGITGFVETFIENDTSGDSVAALTNGIVSAKDYVSPIATETTEAAPEESGSPTDAKDYPQFQDRAVVVADSKVNIRKASSTDAEVIGTLDRSGVCLVDEIGDEWTKIESGSCVGYIANDYLLYGDDAGKWSEENGVGRSATVNTATLKVRADKDEGSECVTLIPEGEEYQVLSVSDEWTEIVIDDDIRGFVRNEYVDVEYDKTLAVSVEEQRAIDAEIERQRQEEERKYLEYLASLEQQNQQQQAADGTQQQTADGTQQQTADGTQQQTQDQQQAAPEPEPAPAPEPEPAPEPSYAAPAGQTGVDLCNFACQFVGCPYVYGGTSLTGGADCSGFVQSVYANYGIGLPRTAAEQSGSGVEVSLSDLQPGDLCFYDNGGYIGHVAIYIGGGQVVHASNPSSGIKISTFNYRTPVKATRLLGQ